jgi:hypothetical protein
MKKQSNQATDLKAKIVIFLAISMSILISSNLGAYAQGNNFFGTTAGAPAATPAAEDDSTPNAVLPGLNETNPNNAAMGTDFSGDEKRMQKKYKANINSAKKLIVKGEGMINSSSKNTNNAEYKKGKILKETGEKWLLQLKGNNPFPEQQKAK